jgi:hypothetical protein
MIIPAVAPRAKANAAYPTGTMPLVWNTVGVIRSWYAWSNGPDHQVAIKLSSPATIMLNAPTRPSLTASQRVRLMPWVQARRKVPVSNSRATSGAPQKTPIRAGTAMTRSLIRPRIVRSGAGGNACRTAAQSLYR